ncbi:putative receptor-type tyrosine-protein phosphatase mosPTP-1 isoform X2 [Lepeophtheirus salmonis]|uniref:putative receptor-type tyrosine-protein phosphatase mosPTP-1 isoform X2 n=1 Tax=Lepeophtheirus salmonis TaxID=72036 RepID=UPI003AF34382
MRKNMKKKKLYLFLKIFLLTIGCVQWVNGKPERRGLHLIMDPDDDGAKVMARAGTNITLACPGILPDSFIYVVEWKCLDCLCSDCPNPNGDGARILRYNDNKLMRWDGQENRRVLDVERYGINFLPVKAEDSGTYHCLINNRLEPDSPILLTVQDVPDAPPSRPMIVGLGPRRVELSWAPPRSSHHHPVLSYRINIKEGEQGNWSRFVDTDVNTTNYVIQDLKPFTTYLFRVGASNILGLSKPSIESYPTKTHRERPSGRPSFVRDKISTSSTTLSIVWKPPPPETLNGEFMGYVLKYEAVNNPMNTRKESITIKEDVLRIQNYTLSNLQKHTEYRVSIAAKNLNGIGPEASIELRTEDGVPLEPRSPRIREISARSIELTWHPPSNARSLGSDLLGYRVYIDPLCSSIRKKKRAGSCRPISPVTISAGYSPKDMLITKIRDLSPATKYKFTLRAFTKKREGPASDDLIVYTDTAPPSSPRIQNITCYGTDEILIEWTRPDIAYTPIKYYQIRFRSRDGSHEEEIRIDVVNDTKRNLASLSNLTTQSVYEFSVIAVVSSKIDPVKTYAGPPSPIKRVYVYGECDPHQAFSKVPYQFEYNAGILSGIICTAASLILIVLITIICRHRSHYEFLALSPRKYLGSGGPGWTGDPESDIPVVLFPKHVTGLHASHDMAFQKDFEAVHDSRKCQNTSSSKAASTYPDILNGRECSSRSPILVDGWAISRNYICLLGEIPFTTDSTWRSIWDQRVSLIVTLLTPIAKDDLSTLSDDTSFGDITVNLVSDDILPDYTIRTVKLKHRKHSKEERLCTQILFPRWPEVGLPRSSDLIHFVKAAFACHQAGGSILVHSRVGMDSCIIFLTLNTLLCQIRSRGEVNVPSYSRHISGIHDLALSSVESYIYIHDTLSVAIECGLLAGIMSVSSSSSSTGTSASTMATAINGIHSSHCSNGSVAYHN